MRRLNDCSFKSEKIAVKLDVGKGKSNAKENYKDLEELLFKC